MTELYGIIAEFTEADDLLGAARKTREAGYEHIEAYAPYPVDGLSEAVGFHKDSVRTLALIGGICGALTGFGLQYYTAVWSYPLDVGGRPLFSWPAWIPIIFECTVLFAGLTTVIGMFVLNGLPRPYHPIFNATSFQFATRDRFFLCIEARDTKFEVASTRAFLQSLSPVGIEEVSP